MARKSLFEMARSQRFVALTTASGLALSAFTATPAFAQTADQPEQAAETTETEDAIIVTGFKKSLESAQNIKRDADTFVDVITA